MWTYEELTKHVGTFGVFQKRALLALYSIALVSSSSIVICSVFVYYTPPHRCYIPKIDGGNSTYNELPETVEESKHTGSANQSESDLSNYIPIEEEINGELKWSQCYRYNNSIFLGNTSTNTTSADRNIIKCDMGWKYFVSSGDVSAVMEFNLVCDKAWLAPLMSSMLMLGWMAGAIVCGFLSDRFGRRFVLLAVLAILFMSFGVLAVLPVWQTHLILWLLIGFATAARANTGIVLLNELTPEKYRYAAGALCNIVAAFCYMLVPIFSYPLKKWRYLLGLYCGLECLVLLLAYCWTRESLVWLLQNGKYKQVNTLLKEMARVNRKSQNFESENLIMHENAIKLEQEKKEESISKSFERKFSYLHLVKIAFLRKRLIIFGTTWFACTMGYLGVSLNTNDLGGDRYVACIISGAVEVPGYILCYITMRHLGGRQSCMILIGFGGLCLLITPFFLNGESSWPVVTCSMIGKLFMSGAFANLYIFTGELFPTLLRTQSYGASSFIARLGGISVPFLLYIGKTYHESIPYLTMGILAVLAATSMCFLPETRKTVLPDTMQDAKNQDKLLRTCCSFKGKATKDDNADVIG